MKQELLEPTPEKTGLHFNNAANALAQDYEMLRRYLGAVRFRSLADEFLSSAPERSKDWRSLPAYLQVHKHPLELAELTLLEVALRNAADAIDIPSLTAATIEILTLEKSNDVKVELHPSFHHLTFTQNTVSIWSSLKAKELPPRAFALGYEQHIIIWRQNQNARLRLVGDEEFELLTQMERSVAPSNQHYLRSWLEAELLTAVTCVAAEVK